MFISYADFGSPNPPYRAKQVGHVMLSVEAAGEPTVASLERQLNYVRRTWAEISKSAAQ